jgi:hypothetical protein
MTYLNLRQTLFVAISAWPLVNMSALDIDAAIGQLVVTALGRDGVTTETLNIKTIDTYPENIEAPGCPILFPHPTNWKGETASVPRVWDTSEYGQKNHADTLNYMFLYAQVGEDRGVHVFYHPATLMLDALEEKLMAIDVHMVGNVSVTFSPMGMQNEKVSGKNFYGCQVSVRCTSLEEK